MYSAISQPVKNVEVIGCSCKNVFRNEKKIKTQTIRTGKSEFKAFLG